MDEDKQKTIAIIADEAHRSHGRKSGSEFLTGFSRQSNRLSYFSFTCTPNFKALEMFGVRNANGAYEPFHSYSIEHCIR
jgi:type I site-specific restriction-modification system R (restriction) subunit